MLILFPSDPLNPRQVDEAFHHEAEAAEALGLRTAKVSIDGSGHPFGMWGLPGTEDTLTPELTIYRGWMLSPDAYRDMYRAALRNGALLINSPDEYRYCHELPNWFWDFEGSTPESIWFPAVGKLGFELNNIARSVEDRLGPGPYVVKDYVKSQKHYWKEACFIKSPSEIIPVTKRFLELQGGDINGGLVYRKFHRLRHIGEHPKSGAPIFNEYRYFVARGRSVLGDTYWSIEEGGAHITRPEHGFQNHWGGVKSNFYSIDVALLEEGDEQWIVIELGDGQVSSIPQPERNAEAFYRKLKKRFDHGTEPVR